MKVILVDDDPQFRLGTMELLSSWGYEVESASNGVEALSLLRRENEPVILITDWMMDKMDGLELVRTVRGEIKLNVRIIVVTGKSDDDALENVLGAGADEFISKPVRWPELKARLRSQARDIQDRRDLLMDDVTETLNRKGILNRLDVEFDRAKRSNSPISVILIDVDDFKHVNEQYSYEVGNSVLHEIAKRVESRIRKYDVVGRYLSGDEILVILPECRGEDAIHKAEAILDSIKAHPIHIPQGKLHIFTSLSLGVAVTTRPFQKEKKDQLLKAAESALKRAKTAGKSRAFLINLEEESAPESPKLLNRIHGFFSRKR